MRRGRTFAAGVPHERHAAPSSAVAGRGQLAGKTATLSGVFVKIDYPSPSKRQEAATPSANITGCHSVLGVRLGILLSSPISFASVCAPVIPSATIPACIWKLVTACRVSGP